MNLRDIPDSITVTSTIEGDLVIAGIVLLKPNTPQTITFKTFHERYREGLYKAICVSVASGVVTTEDPVADVAPAPAIARDYLIPPTPVVEAPAPAPEAPAPAPVVEAPAPAPEAPAPADEHTDPVVVLDEPAAPAAPEPVL